MIGRRALVSGLLAGALVPHPVVRAGENVFAGKTITYIVSTKPGGGYDTMGRLVSKYLETHIPDVRVLVKNVPGAGHMVGCQTIFSAAPDGFTIGTFNTGLIYAQLAGVLDSSLDLGKMSWIGKAAIESRVIVVAANSDIATLDDLKRPGRVLKIGVNAKGGTAHIDSMLLAQTFGYNFKHIFGFEGTDAELSLAARRDRFDHGIAQLPRRLRDERQWSLSRRIWRRTRIEYSARRRPHPDRSTKSG